MAEGSSITMGNENWPGNHPGYPYFSVTYGAYNDQPSLFFSSPWYQADFSGSTWLTTEWDGEQSDLSFTDWEDATILVRCACSLAPPRPCPCLCVDVAWRV